MFKISASRLQRPPGNRSPGKRSLDRAAKLHAHPFCHSERSEESLFLFAGLNRRKIPRSARNDKINYFFSNLLSTQRLGSKRFFRTHYFAFRMNFSTAEMSLVVA